MKIFLDTANIGEISRFAFVIDGVTTNPTLMSQEKTGYHIREHITQIARIVDGPISVEAMSQTAPEIVREAEELATISHNVVIKIPMNEAGLEATKILAAQGIKTNVTLIFSANQAYLAAKAGATYASIFVGRLDDIGHDGMEVVRDTMEIYRQHHLETRLDHRKRPSSSPCHQCSQGRVPRDHHPAQGPRTDVQAQPHGCRTEEVL